MQHFLELMIKNQLPTPQPQCFLWAMKLNVTRQMEIANSNTMPEQLQPCKLDKYSDLSYRVILPPFNRETFRVEQNDFDGLYNWNKCAIHIIYIVKYDKRCNLEVKQQWR